jgi:hypothetical protein
MPMSYRQNTSLGICPLIPWDWLLGLALEGVSHRRTRFSTCERHLARPQLPVKVSVPVLFAIKSQHGVVEDDFEYRAGS